MGETLRARLLYGVHFCDHSRGRYSLPKCANKKECASTLFSVWLFFLNGPGQCSPVFSTTPRISAVSSCRVCNREWRRSNHNASGRIRTYSRGYPLLPAHAQSRTCSPRPKRAMPYKAPAIAHSRPLSTTTTIHHCNIDGDSGSTTAGRGMYTGSEPPMSVYSNDRGIPRCLLINLTPKS